MARPDKTPMGEDPLYASIYQPKNVKIRTDAKRP
jgi:hypothetical protein